MVLCCPSQNRIDLPKYRLAGTKHINIQLSKCGLQIAMFVKEILVDIVVT